MSDPFQSDHVISQYITLSLKTIIDSSGPGLPFFLAFVTYFFYLIVRRPMKAYMKKYKFGFELGEMEENFAPYFCNLDTVDKHWTIREERYNRKQFKYSTMPNATLESYKKGCVTKGEEFRTV